VCRAAAEQKKLKEARAAAALEGFRQLLDDVLVLERHVVQQVCMAHGLAVPACVYEVSNRVWIHDTTTDLRHTAQPRPCVRVGSAVSGEAERRCADVRPQTRADERAAARAALEEGEAGGQEEGGRRRKRRRRAGGAQGGRPRAT
jgi:hypothetical protein